MSEYASKGIAGSGLGLGIAGTALGLLNNSGGLGGLLGWNNGNPAYVNHFEMAQSSKIAELETEVKLRDANVYTLGEMGKLRDYVERRFDRVEHELCDQRVYNATNTATMACIKGQVDELMALTIRRVPNSSICPGWGEVTVTTTPTTTPAAGA